MAGNALDGLALVDFVIESLEKTIAQVAKEKYKENFILHDIGYVGVVMLSYEADDQTITDVLKEFDIKTAQEYYDYNRKHRAELSLPKNIYDFLFLSFSIRIA